MRVVFVSAVGVSNNPCSDTYCGPNAYSEVEAANVASYIENADTVWRVFYTVHSYGQLWMAPWGYTTDQPENYDALVCSRKYHLFICSRNFHFYSIVLLHA